MAALPRIDTLVSRPGRPAGTGAARPPGSTRRHQVLHAHRKDTTERNSVVVLPVLIQPGRTNRVACVSHLSGEGCSATRLGSRLRLRCWACSLQETPLLRTSLGQGTGTLSTVHQVWRLTGLGDFFLMSV